MTDAARLADSLDELLAPLERGRNLAWWEASVDATDANAERQAETELAYSAALADADLFARVSAAADGDPLARRRLELLGREMLPHQAPESIRTQIVELEASVGMRFSRHRGVVRGEEVDDNAIKRVLRESDDVDERREAWEASKTVGAEVAEDVRRLARLRNEAARAVGHRDWYALALASSELDERKLAETLAAADRATAEPFARWKGALDARLCERFGCAETELSPWHYADPFFQEPPREGAVDLDPLFEGRDVVELATRTFEDIGLPAAGIIERSDLYPRAGKNQHAFCIGIDRVRDVRVLANVVDTQSWADAMLHELGHGVFDLGYSGDLPWTLRTAHLVTTEATALLFGALSGERTWLEGVLGLGPAEGGELEARLAAARAASLLVFTRWALVMNGLERALYADPDGDLDSTWWELVARHQLLTPPEGRAAPDWAAKIHVAVAPVYYHTYLYGAIVALQLRDALREAVGGIVGRPEAGALLRERLFAPGQSIRWDELVEQASGAPLAVDSLAREVAAA